MNYIKQYSKLSKCIYVVALSKLIQTIGAFIWPLFTIVLKTKLGLSDEVTAIFISVSVSSGFIGSLFGGYISDHLGRKRTIVVFELLASISFISTLLVDNPYIIASLLASGMFFFSLSGPAHNSLLANVSKTDEKELAYSLHIQMTKIGVILGPVLGGLLLVSHFELFIVLDVLTTILGVILLLLFVKEKDDKVGVNPFERASEASLFNLVKNRPIIIYYALLSLFIAVIYGQMDYTLPLFMIDSLENGKELFGYLYSFNGLVIVLFTAMLTYLFRRMSGSRKVLLGILLYTIALFSNIFVYRPSHFFIVMFIFSIGEMFTAIGMGPKLSKMVPVNMYGKVISFVQIFYVLGHLIATVIPAILLTNGFIYKEVWSVLSVVAFAGLIILIYVQHKNAALLDKLDSYDRNRN